MKPTTLFAAVAAVAASAVLPMAANADETITINGVKWTYIDRDDTAKTITLGASGSMSTSRSAHKRLDDHRQVVGEYGRLFEETK